MIVPDGALNYLPFNLLFLPNTQEYLFTKYDIIHNPSSSIIDSLRKFAVSEQKAPLELAIAADAVFSLEDDRLERDKGDKVDKVDKVDKGERFSPLQRTFAISPEMNFGAGYGKIL